MSTQVAAVVEAEAAAVVIDVCEIFLIAYERVVTFLVKPNLNARLCAARKGVCQRSSWLLCCVTDYL